MNNTDNLLIELKKTRKPFKVTVTSGTVVDILPMSLSQQKVMLDAAFQGVTGIYRFNNTLNKIINDNVQTPHPFTTIDRVILAISLRIRLKDMFDDEENMASFKLSTKVPVYTDIESIGEEVIRGEDISFVVAPPSLDIDTKFNNFILSTYKDESNTKQDLSKFAGDVYINEIAKFIKAIKIHDQQETTYNLHDEPWKSVKVLDAVSSVDLTAVTSYIKRVRDVESKFLPTTPGGKKIDILPSLFVV